MLELIWYEAGRNVSVMLMNPGQSPHRFHQAPDTFSGGEIRALENEERCDSLTQIHQWPWWFKISFSIWEWKNYSCEQRTVRLLFWPTSSWRVGAYKRSVLNQTPLKCCVQTKHTHWSTHKYNQQTDSSLDKSCRKACLSCLLMKYRLRAKNLLTVFLSEAVNDQACAFITSVQ